MEAPTSGLSREQMVDAFMKHIANSYTKIEGDLKRIKCKKCGTRIEQVTCFISIHNKDWNGCVGSGKIEQVPLPYCPKCEGVPTRTSTCIHE